VVGAFWDSGGLVCGVPVGVEKYPEKFAGGPPLIDRAHEAGGVGIDRAHEVGGAGIDRAHDDVQLVAPAMKTPAWGCAPHERKWEHLATFGRRAAGRQRLIVRGRA